MEVFIIFVLFIILWLLIDIRKSVILQYNQQSEFNHPLHSPVDILMQNQEIDRLNAEQKKANAELDAYLRTHEEEFKVKKNIDPSTEHLSLLRSFINSNHKCDRAIKIKNKMVENNYAIISGKKTMKQAYEEYMKILPDLSSHTDDSYEKLLAHK